MTNNQKPDPQLDQLLASAEPLKPSITLRNNILDDAQKYVRSKSIAPEISRVQSFFNRIAQFGINNPYPAAAFVLSFSLITGFFSGGALDPLSNSEINDAEPETLISLALLSEYDEPSE